MFNSNTAEFKNVPHLESGRATTITCGEHFSAKIDRAFSAATDPRRDSGGALYPE